MVAIEFRDGEVRVGAGEMFRGSERRGASSGRGERMLRDAGSGPRRGEHRRCGWCLHGTERLVWSRNDVFLGSSVADKPERTGLALDAAPLGRHRVWWLVSGWSPCRRWKFARYPLVGLVGGGYRQRTFRNIEDSDGNRDFSISTAPAAAPN